MNKKIILALLGIVIVPNILFACFDTYLFLQKRSMVYPKGQWVVDGAGEYTVNRFDNSSMDLFTGNFNTYYGLNNKISFQMGVSSSEKQRTKFAIDAYGIRGVYGLIQSYKDFYNLDIILEHNAPFGLEEAVFEFSTPNIIYKNEFVFVFHPVLGFGKNVAFGIRGHGGIFYTINGIGLVGFGAEYESAQSGSQLGQRLIKGEAGTSLFFGAQMGYLYIQNEFIKGWGGADAKDFGFATTLKVILPTFGSKSE